MDWEGSEKVNVNVLKDNFVCRMSFLHNDFYRPSTWQGRHFLLNDDNVLIVSFKPALQKNPEDNPPWPP